MYHRNKPFLNQSTQSWTNWLVVKKIQKTAVHKALQWHAVGRKFPKIAVHKALQQFRTLLKPSELNVECIGSKIVPKSTYAVQNLT